MEIKQKILNFICENFGVEEDEIDLDDSLVEQGIVDSFGLVELSLFFSKEFGVESTNTDITKENYGSVEKMVMYLKRKQEEVDKEGTDSGVI